MPVKKPELFSTSWRAQIAYPMFASDAAFVTAKGSAASLNDRYFNTTTNTERVHNGTIFQDRTVQSSGVIISPTTAIVTPWIDASNPQRLADNQVRINRENAIEDYALVGCPLRYSEDNDTWSYGLISSVTINLTTVDLTFTGAAMTTSNDGYVQIGSPDMVSEPVEVFFGGNASVGDDKNPSINFRRKFWNKVNSFIVDIRAVANTAASGQNLLVTLARRTVGADVVQLNLGQATTPVSAGAVLTNQDLIKGDEIFYNFDQVGSGTPGANIEVSFLAVFTPFTVQKYIPVINPVGPYSFILYGHTHVSGAVLNRIEYMEVTTNTGNTSNRGIGTVARICTEVGFSNTILFGCGGFTNTARSTPSNVIDYIDFASITGDATDRGDKATARSCGTGVSGTQFSFLINGNTSTTAGNRTNQIEVFDNTLVSGNASNTGTDNQAREFSGSAQNSTKGVIAGGVNTSSGNLNNITYIPTTTNSVTGDVYGTLTVAVRCPVGFSWYASDQAIFAGGLSTTSQNTIQIVDLSVGTDNAANTGTLITAKHAGSPHSSSSHGNYFSGSTSNTLFSSTVTNLVENFDFTTGTNNVNNRGDVQTASVACTGGR